MRAGLPLLRTGLPLLVDDLDAKLRALTRIGDLGQLAKDLDAAGGGVGGTDTSE
jgi:hypothetical protein